MYLIIDTLSGRATFSFQVPKAMDDSVRDNGRELVLNACPQLKSLNVTLEVEGITTLTFE